MKLKDVKVGELYELVDYANQAFVGHKVTAIEVGVQSERYNYPVVQVRQQAAAGSLTFQVPARRLRRTWEEAEIARTEEEIKDSRRRAIISKMSDIWLDLETVHSTVLWDGTRSSKGKTAIQEETNDHDV